MKNINNGGSAFPSITIKQIGDPCYNQPTRLYEQGMSLRDYFAARAMQGFLASNCKAPIENENDLALVCYKIADSMLEARNK